MRTRQDGLSPLIVPVAARQGSQVLSSFLGQRKRLGGASGLQKEVGEIGSRKSGQLMSSAYGTFEHLQRLFEEGLRPRVPARCLHQDGYVAHAHRNILVLWAVNLLPDPQ